MNDDKHFGFMKQYKKIRFLMEHMGLVRYHRPMIAFCEEYFNNGYSFNGDGDGVVGVEIGCRAGVNAVQIIRRLPVSKVFLIDPFVPYYDRAAYTDGQQEFFRKQFIRNLGPYQDRFHFVQDYSFNVTHVIPDDLDFCYIDGGHHYDEVMKDISLYYPKIRSGGVIGGHDWNWKEVASAVLDFCREHGLYDDLMGVDPDWWIVKK